MPSVPESSHGMGQWPRRWSGSNAQGVFAMVGIASRDRFVRSSSRPVRQAAQSPSRQPVSTANQSSPLTARPRSQRLP